MALLISSPSLAVILRRLHFTRPLSVAAVLLLPLFSTGCKLMENDWWNPDHYRDERAVDIDHRLDKAEPIVKNPF
ncbi:MAG TPA: hypothetical protein VH107_04305 [Lacipirellulaceae bacterium]|nr:hypothetical protein [Lacipirellulaceae bacterium]